MSSSLIVLSILLSGCDAFFQEVMVCFPSTGVEVWTSKKYKFEQGDFGTRIILKKKSSAGHEYIREYSTEIDCIKQSNI